MEPKIRLKGFSGEWEDRTLEATFSTRNGYTPSKNVDAFWENGNIPWFRMEDIRENGGILNDAIQHISPLAVKGGGLFAPNSIIMGTTATIGLHALLTVPALSNQQFTNFELRNTCKEDYDSLFTYYSFFKVDALAKTYANSGGLLAVNVPSLMKASYYTPCKEEQKAIASYFQHLDSLIQSTTKKIESLKQVKAASLQSMFPQEGETTPRVRFKGFEGEWEKVAIKDRASFSKGRGYSKSDLQEVGTPIILYGRMYTKYEVCISNVDTYANFVPNSVLSNGDEVIMPASGETPEDISIASAILSKGIILGGDLNVMRFDTKKNNTTFIALSLSVGKAKKDLSNMAQGKSVVHIHNSDIEKISIPMPSFDEQQKISDYFTNLDSQITLQSQRLEKLKQIKSACLDNMFV